ncbi:MAG: hypothetical protein Q8M88_01740 [Phenylobacterium sp.]|uniref:hypothetical protein n=1 Tax=Phenylobacterium sp. TaxID=1871053 RepID=UPI00273759A4|nr:hypothetical protein [Phenylobacterium sp.]MDP3173139.1 hypothetical protein [Phenylobacterium sp.]
MDARFAYVAACLTLTACATTQGPAQVGVTSPSAQSSSAAFRSTDFAWSTAPGRAVIQGQLTFRPNGVGYSCAAAGVVATPDTPWVRSRMQILYNSAEAASLPAEEVRRRTPPERSQDYSSFVKRATCDAVGRFSFTGVPDGAWYVITVARPVYAGSGKDMALMRRVVVRNGKTVNVKL